MKVDSWKSKGTEATRRSSCEGKQQFDRATANRVVRETKRVRLTSYKCRFCGHWHIGNPKKVSKT